MIVGGAEVNPKYSIPWQVYIAPRGRRTACGGTLISDRHVLTAAHCTQRWFGGQFQYEFDVVVGEHDLTSSSDGTPYRVCDFVDHPKFDNKEYLDENNLYIDYDFSILHLKTSVTFGPRVEPAYLPEKKYLPEAHDSKDFFAGKMLTVSGWGVWWRNGPLSDVLYSVMVPGITEAQCIRNYNRKQIKSNNLCAGFSYGTKDACQGDSGGMFSYLISFLHFYWVTILKYTDALNFISISIITKT